MGFLHHLLAQDLGFLWEPRHYHLHQWGEPWVQEQLYKQLYKLLQHKWEFQAQGGELWEHRLQLNLLGLECLELQPVLRGRGC